MSFLLGTFGKYCTSKYANKFVLLAEATAIDGTQQKTVFEQGFVWSGQSKHKESQRNRIIPLHGTAGILAGKIFDRQNYKPVQFDGDFTRKILENPRILAKSIWGRYVGVLCNEQKKTFSLIRDPQGLSTLFYIQVDGGVLFSTDLKLLYEAMDEKPSLDMQFFAEHLVHRNQALPTTPFEKVQELLPGMSVTFTKEGTASHELLWDLDTIKSSFIEDTNTFEEELLATLKSCVRAWTEDASGVCVELSGGTDSSGVMLLLKEVLPQDKKLIAVNYTDSKTPSSNEIEYAQEVADLCKAPLYFTDWQTATLLDPLPSTWFPNKPSSFFMFYNIRKQVQEYAQQNNCDEIMNGQGGDHLFLAPQPKCAIADYWLDHGFHGIRKPFNEIVGVYRSPWFVIAKESCKNVINYYRGMYKNPYQQPIEYLDKDFLAQLPLHDFYLNDRLINFYPAKAAQIESMYQAVSYSERDQFSSTITHPLLSQPLVEMGLAIPTYQSFANGFDRIFFRNAVSKIQKPKALWRKIKGQTTSSMSKACAQQHQEIRDILFSGKIVQSGIVDKQWLDRELTRMRHGQVDKLWPVIHMLTGQVWINKWNL